MASKQAIAISRAEALTRIGVSAAHLAARDGVAVPDFPRQGRDPDLLRNEQLAWMADVLESVLNPPEPTEDDGPNLSKMNRNELNAYATELGIEAPEKLANKGAVVEAIEAALAAEEAQDDGEKPDAGDESSSDESDTGDGTEAQDEAPEGQSGDDKPAPPEDAS